MATIAIKTPGEVAETLRQRTACDRGFLSRHWTVSLTALALLGFLTYRIVMMTAGLVLVGDFIWFVIHRARMLKHWELGRR